METRIQIPTFFVAEGGAIGVFIRGASWQIHGAYKKGVKVCQRGKIVRLVTVLRLRLFLRIGCGNRAGLRLLHSRCLCSSGESFGDRPLDLIPSPCLRCFRCLSERRLELLQTGDELVGLGVDDPRGQFRAKTAGNRRRDLPQPVLVNANHRHVRKARPSGIWRHCRLHGQWWCVMEISQAMVWPDRSRSKSTLPWPSNTGFSMTLRKPSRLRRLFDPFLNGLVLRSAPAQDRGAFRRASVPPLSAVLLLQRLAVWVSTGAKTEGAAGEVAEVATEAAVEPEGQPLRAPCQMKAVEQEGQSSPASGCGTGGFSVTTGWLRSVSLCRLLRFPCFGAKLGLNLCSWRSIFPPRSRNHFLPSFRRFLFINLFWQRNREVEIKIASFNASDGLANFQVFANPALQRRKNLPPASWRPRRRPGTRSVWLDGTLPRWPLPRCAATGATRDAPA